MKPTCLFALPLVCLLSVGLAGCAGNDEGAPAGDESAVVSRGDLLVVPCPIEPNANGELVPICPPCQLDVLADGTTVSLCPPPPPPCGPLPLAADSNLICPCPATPLREGEKPVCPQLPPTPSVRNR